MTIQIKPHWWQPALRSFGGTRVGTRINRTLLPRLDRLVLRLSGGRNTATAWIAGLPMIMLTTTGAKSGKARTTPLIGIPDGRKIVLIASNWGQKKHPAWYFNLRAHPEVQVTVKGEMRPYSAREATPKERERYWRRAIQLYPGYASYREWCGDRVIPIMVLSPSQDAQEAG